MGACRKIYKHRSHNLLLRQMLGSNAFPKISCLEPSKCGKPTYLHCSMSGLDGVPWVSRVCGYQDRTTWTCLSTSDCLSQCRCQVAKNQKTFLGVLRTWERDFLIPKTCFSSTQKLNPMCCFDTSIVFLRSAPSCCVACWVVFAHHLESLCQCMSPMGFKSSSVTA